MLKQMEAQHTLYDSLEEMLAPEKLSELLSRPVSSVEVRPMTDHYGHSKLYYVNINAGRLVLKERLSMEHDYIRYASGDQHCREVRLWQYGLLDELRPHIEHKILACARDGDGWGILMHDLSDGLFGGENHKMSPRHVEVFLDRLARLHARFWNDPRLEDPRIRMNDSISRLKITSPRLVQNHICDQTGGFPRAIRQGWEGIRQGWEILESLVEPDVFQTIYSLNENPGHLVAALERYPYTLLHGDYRDVNFAYLEPDQAAVFDWEQASRDLMTVDLAWFSGGADVRNTVGKTDAVRYYRNRLETYLNISFDDDTWQAMLDLGFLYDAVLMAAVHAYFSKHHKRSEHRAHLEMRIKEHVQSIRDGLRWL